jgi:CubicO group peptidase (beta-lactamase class C family)
MNRRAFLTAAAASSVLSASAQQIARAQSMPRFYEAARYSSERDGVSFLVARHGVVLGEDYPGGAPDARWHIGAGTRMFAPLLAGSLIQDRLLNLDEPVAGTLTEWSQDERRLAIPVRSLLNGTSGVAFPRRGERSLAAALALEPIATMGQAFSNDESAYILLVEIARRKLTAANAESDPARWLTTRTLLPIGCVPIGWTRMADGAPRFDDGAAVSARGWAQAGELVRREGVWRARQLADSSVLQEAMRGSFAEPRAGIGFWLAHQERRDPPIESDLWRVSHPAPADLVMAAGAGGQRLYIAPSAGLVIARQSRETSGPWSDAQFLTLVWRDL